MLGSIAAVILIVLMGCEQPLQSSVIYDQTVRKNFPAELTAESTADFPDDPQPTQLFDYATLDKSDGKYVVAAYSNGFSGAVEIFRIANEGLERVAEAPNGILLSGMVPKVQLSDLDSDQQPEIVVSFAANQGNVTWIFTWDDNVLTSIGPTNLTMDGQRFSLLNEPVMMDVDGDGVSEIISDNDPSGAASNDGNSHLFRLKAGQYVPDGTLSFFGVYSRHEGAPFTFKESFHLLDVNKNYVLTVINGDGAGEYLVKSAELRLNDLLILGPDQFRSPKRIITVPVTLTEANTIEVELRSAPDSRLAVIVQSAE